MKRSAYYSRNNSFSRSANAEAAENEGRFPRTRAAKHLGVSTASFDRGVAKARYVPTEWHHVGKYAARVDYYDTEELRTNKMFWLGARNKNNAAYCREQIRKIIRENLFPKIEIKKHPVFAKVLTAKLEGRGRALETVVSHFKNFSLNRGAKSVQSVFVKYGEEYSEDYRVRRDGSVYSAGLHLTSAGNYVPVFALTQKNINAVIREASKKKFSRFTERQQMWVASNSYSFNRHNVHAVIIRLRDGVIQGNSLMYCSTGDWLAAAKILVKQGNAEGYTVEGERVRIKMIKHEKSN